MAILSLLWMARPSQRFKLGRGGALTPLFMNYDWS
jgi:hypothetical protein